MEGNILSFTLLKSYTELKDFASKLGLIFARSFDLSDGLIDYSGTFYHKNNPIAFFERYELYIFNTEKNARRANLLEKKLKANKFI